MRRRGDIVTRSVLDWLEEIARADIIVTGHTHLERLAYREGVLQVNSGSPTHPHLYSTRLGTVGLLDLGPGRLEARIVRLGESPGLRNPGVEMSFSLGNGKVPMKTEGAPPGDAAGVSPRRAGGPPSAPCGP